MVTGTRKKTGGRRAGVPNKATAARDAQRAAPPDDRVSPASRARADAAPEVETAAAFPKYRLAQVASLIAYDKNPRTHSPAQVDLIAKLIGEYGFTNPVLVDGKRGIVAGHGRVMAARKLGMDVVPVIELSHLTAAQRRAYVIADNASALQSGWNSELLALELGELRDAGFDLALTGFDALELGALLGEGAGGGASEPPEPPIDAKVCCPQCGHEFPTVAKAFRRIAAK